MKKHKLLPDTKEIKESADLIQAAIDIENAAYDTFLKDTLKARQTGNKTEYEKAKQSFLEAGKKADKLRLKANEIWEAYPGINPMHMNLQGYTPAEQRDNLISMVDKDMDKLTDTSVNLPIPTELPEPEPEEKSVYCAMYHGPEIDYLMQISAKELPIKIDNIIDTAEYIGPSYTITLNQYSKLLDKNLSSIRISTQKLLDALVMDITRKNSKGKKIETMAILDMEKYMKSCGKSLSKSNKDKERKKIKEDLDILISISLQWEGDIDKQVKRMGKNRNRNKDCININMQICSGTALIRNSLIIVNFTPEMVFYLTSTNYIMWYPENLLKIDERNPCAYHIGRKLANYYSNLNNHKQGRACIISIETLLKNIKDIPSEAKVSGRHYYRQRIEPLFRALDALVNINVLEKWELCNAKMKPLSKSQQDRKDYKSILKLYIHFELTENKKLIQYINQSNPKTISKAKKQEGN